MLQARPLLLHAIETGKFDGLIDLRLGKRYVESQMFRMIEVAAACVRHSAPKRPCMVQVILINPIQNSISTSLFLSCNSNGTWVYRWWELWTLKVTCPTSPMVSNLDRALPMILNNTVKTSLTSGNWRSKTAPTTMVTVANTIPEKWMQLGNHGEVKITQVVNQKLELLRDKVAA